MQDYLRGVEKKIRDYKSVKAQSVKSFKSYVDDSVLFTFTKQAPKEFIDEYIPRKMEIFRMMSLKNETYTKDLVENEVVKLVKNGSVKAS
jgi:hypothetical protein